MARAARSKRPLPGARRLLRLLLRRAARGTRPTSRRRRAAAAAAASSRRVVDARDSCTLLAFARKNGQARWQVRNRQDARRGHLWQGARARGFASLFFARSPRARPSPRRSPILLPPRAAPRRSSSPSTPRRAKRWPSRSWTRRRSRSRTWARRSRRRRVKAGRAAVSRELDVVGEGPRRH